jgi:hypothetical protein
MLTTQSRNSSIELVFQYEKLFGHVDGANCGPMVNDAATGHASTCLATWPILEDRTESLRLTERT